MPRTKIDHEYRKYIRSFPCIVADATGNTALCSGPVEFCHVHHAGHGGKDVPDHGNGFPGCFRHHTGGDTSYHTMGCYSFQMYWGVDVGRRATELGRWYGRGIPFLELQ